MQSSPQQQPVVYRTTVALDPRFPISVEPHMRFGRIPVMHLHVHDTLEIGCCHQGNGVYLVGGKLLAYRPGSVVIVNGTQMHLPCSSSEASEFTWVNCDPAGMLLPQGNDPALADMAFMCADTFPGVFEPDVYPRVCSLAGDLVTELSAVREGYQATARALMVLLLTELHRLSRGQGGPLPAAEADDWTRLMPALTHMREHYREAVRVPALARMSAMSATNFCRVFRRALGSSPQEYLCRLRITMATAGLGSSGKGIAQVAYDNGFNTLSCFNRLFRRIMGMSPRQWRKQRSGGLR